MRSEPVQLSVGLLGPLSATLNGIQVTPSAPKQRQVLALLALNAGRVVTVPTLIEELWGDRPPRSYATTLQTYIFQLRNGLEAAAPGGPAARGMLSTRHAGYQLEHVHTDVEDFSALAQAGRMAAEEGDHHVASERLSGALGIWRGPALVDVRMGRVLELEAASLKETQMGVLNRRINADLALGRHDDMLGELTLAVARNPMNEIFCGFMMIALYRSGHVARSLEAFHRLRSVLQDELGVEPCPRVQRLQAAILSGDPALESPSWSATKLHADLFSA
jgi:DNA-binding SARP family transcriptional activator